MRFRHWLKTEDSTSNLLKQFIEQEQLVLFFKKNNEYFGAGEDSRVVFARLKNPDEDSNEGWEDEASFMAVNLSKLAGGHPVQSVFDKKSLKDIKVVDRDEAIANAKPSSSGDISGIRIIRIGVAAPGDANLPRTDEK